MGVVDLIEDDVVGNDSDATFETLKKDPKKLILIIVGSFLLLTVVRMAFINYFDSGATRYACINHAAYMNEQSLEGASFADMNSAQLESLEGEPIVWSVRRHIRSNKLGLFNRDSARCEFTSNVADLGEITVKMSDAKTGQFYLFAKFLGIMLQIGLVASFIRWFNYRFIE